MQLKIVYSRGSPFDIHVSYWAYMDALKQGLCLDTMFFWWFLRNHQDTSRVMRDKINHHVVAKWSLVTNVIDD